MQILSILFLHQKFLDTCQSYRGTSPLHHHQQSAKPNRSLSLSQNHQQRSDLQAGGRRRNPEEIQNPRNGRPLLILQPYMIKSVRRAQILFRNVFFRTFFPPLCSVRKSDGPQRSSWITPGDPIPPGRRERPDVHADSGVRHPVGRLLWRPRPPVYSKIYMGFMSRSFNNSMD